MSTSFFSLVSFFVFQHQNPRAALDPSSRAQALKIGKPLRRPLSMGQISFL